MEFPSRPISASEFFERFVPKAFAESELPPGAEKADVKLGICLEGEGGGEWLFHLKRGSLSVEPGSRREAAVTLRQSVADWRGALWEGRGGAFGQQASAFFRPGAAAAGGTLGAAGAAALNPVALTQLQQLDGEVKMVVSGDPGGSADSTDSAGSVEDWSLAVKLGPGEFPAEPTTTITISAEDAQAMSRGELDPLEAFMSGRIQVAGDMALMMQVQAIQLQAAAPRTSSGSDD